jgi:hypothetical protein
MLSCVDCHHAAVSVSDIESEGPLLFCHRYPPVLFILDGHVTQAHPEADEICGEFTP